MKTNRKRLRLIECYLKVNCWLYTVVIITFIQLDLSYMGSGVALFYYLFMPCSL